MGVRVRIAADEMLDELDAQRLHVVKQKTDHGYVRLAVSHNPDWYRNLCREYERPRRGYSKLKTLIRRCWVIKALRRIRDGERKGVYVGRVLPFVEARAKGFRQPKMTAERRRMMAIPF